jgi:hypothetical protein
LVLARYKHGLAQVRAAIGAGTREPATDGLDLRGGVKTSEKKSDGHDEAHYVPGHAGLLIVCRPTGESPGGPGRFDLPLRAHAGRADRVVEILVDGAMVLYAIALG